MVFNSYLFILAFLPAVTVGFFLCNRIGKTAGKVFLIIASIIFYMYGGINTSWILGVSILANLLLSVLMVRYRHYGKIFLIVMIVFDVALLFVFKYVGFSLGLIEMISGTQIKAPDIIMPLAVSFFTFQQIMWAVKLYRGELSDAGILDYLFYILYFPKLIMGPLCDPKDLISKVNDESAAKADWNNIAHGLILFSLGLFKKVILADTFAVWVNWGYNNIDSATSADWFLILLFYTFEIYFDFSGYCDMAVGVSGMLNITLPINFDSPYKSISIRDFWKRWHISLTRFLTEYIYIPIGGNRKGTVRTCVNTLIVFLISGLWHGADLTFVLWGALHGALSVSDRITDKYLKRVPRMIRWFFTFLAVSILWLLFRSESISQWISILAKMFSFSDMHISDGLIYELAVPEIIVNLGHLNWFHDHIVRGFSIWMYLIAAFVICLIPENNYKARKNLSIWTMAVTAILFFTGVICLGKESVFVYFGF